MVDGNATKIVIISMIEYSVIVCTICCRGAHVVRHNVCFVLIVVVEFDAKRWIEILYPKKSYVYNTSAIGTIEGSLWYYVQKNDVKWTCFVVRVYILYKLCF